MRDKKKIKILRKVIKRICDQNPEMQELVDASMVQVCAEESLSSEQVFFVLLFFAVVFIIMAILEKNLNECLKFLCEKTTYGNSRGFSSTRLFLRLGF